MATTDILKGTANMATQEAHRKPENIPDCDFCDQRARYDSNTIYGSHAYLCRDHYEEIGRPPTTEFIPIEERDIDEPDTIKTVSVPLTLDATPQVECPYCGQPRAVEPDANYTVECAGCGNRYKIRSMI